LVLQGRLTTPPIADNLRLFATADYANAHPPEGFTERARVGAGVEWRGPDLTASVFPTQSWGTLPRPGGVATVDWLVTDQVRLAFSAELYSWDTPLRALLFGITANEYAAKATYRWHESRSLSGSFAYLPFTDGNQRFTGGLNFKQRLINLPGFDLTGLAEGYASSNNQPNAPYYNPTRDLALTGGLLAEHLLWRRYDNSLVQALTIDAGLYSEYGYSDNWIGTVNYEHRWRFDPLTEFRYGVMLTRRVYDGSVENTLMFIVGLRQRI
jgi:biofilm PGA synthesis protein PgaA